MTLECADIQALDVLSSAQAPHLRLRRVFHLQYDDNKTQNKFGGQGTLAKHERVSTLPIHDQKSDIVEALWWPETPPGGDQQLEAKTTRVLQGEIHLKSSLYPTTHLGDFSITVRATASASPSDIVDTGRIQFTVLCSVVCSERRGVYPGGR